MSGDCKFDDHIQNVVKQSQRTSAWVLRTFRTRNKFVMRTLLKSIVIPTAEYASVLWCPTNVTMINKIEEIQRRFTSKIDLYQTYDPNLKKLVCTTDYKDRLKDLNLYSLEQRRDRFAIMYIYYIKVQCRYIFAIYTYIKCLHTHIYVTVSWTIN